MIRDAGSSSPPRAVPYYGDTVSGIEDSAARPIVDTHRAPIGEMAARTLVEALKSTDDRAERHYLEVKSQIDLSSKLGAAKVAKFILGAANRMPDRAAQHFEGYGVLVLGVAVGDMPGILPVEAKDLEEAVRPYLSARGPSWDLVRVPVSDSREVLVILVAPPRYGQDAFLCHKQYQSDKKTEVNYSLQDGGIYLRADGATRPALAEEIEMLRERARRGHPAVDVDVTVAGYANALVYQETLIEEFLEARRGALLALLSTRQIRYAAEVSLMSTLQKKEDRTTDEYRAEISGWESEVRRAWNGSVDRLVAASGSRLTVVITNQVNLFMQGVELVLRLDGPVEGLEPEKIDEVPVGLWLPEEPRPWGPRPTFDPNLITVRPLGYPPLRATNPVTVRNGHPLTITVQVGDLRPQRTYTTEDHGVVLVCRDPELTAIRGTWSLTARDHNEVFRDEFSVPVRPTADVTSSLRDFLFGVA